MAGLVLLPQEAVQKHSDFVKEPSSDEKDAVLENASKSYQVSPLEEECNVIRTLPEDLAVEYTEKTDVHNRSLKHSYSANFIGESCTCSIPSLKVDQGIKSTNLDHSFRQFQILQQQKEGAFAPIPSIDIEFEDEVDGVFKHFEVGNFLNFRRKNAPLTVQPSDWQHDSELVARGIILRHHYSEQEKVAICERAFEQQITIPKFISNEKYPSWGVHFDNPENKDYFFCKDNCVEDFFDYIVAPIINGSQLLAKLEQIDMSEEVKYRYCSQELIPPGISITSQADGRFKFILTDRAEALKSQKLKNMILFLQNKLTEREKIEMTLCSLQQINVMRTNKWIPDGVTVKEIVAGHGQYRLVVNDFQKFGLALNTDNKKVQQCLRYLDEVPQQKRVIESVNDVVCNTRMSLKAAKQLKNQFRNYLDGGKNVSLKIKKTTSSLRNPSVYLQIKQKELEQLVATPGGVKLCEKMVWCVKRVFVVSHQIRKLEETLEKVEKRGILHKLLREHGTLKQIEILKIASFYRIPHTDSETLYDYIDQVDGGPLYLNWDRLRFTDLSTIEMNQFCDYLLKKHAENRRIQYYDLPQPRQNFFTKLGVSTVKFISP